MKSVRTLSLTSRFLWIAGAIAVLAAAVASALIAGEKVRKVDKRAEYHIQVLENERYVAGWQDRTPVTLAAVRKRLEARTRWVDRMVLHAGARRTLADLSPLIHETAELGFGRYQLRVEDSSVNFHLPGCCCIRKTIEHPVIVDLRTDQTVPLDGKDICRQCRILVDDAIPLGELVRVMREYAAKFDSLEVCAPSLLLLRDEREDEVRQEGPYEAFLRKQRNARRE